MRVGALAFCLAVLPSAALAAPPPPSSPPPTNGAATPAAGAGAGTTAPAPAPKDYTLEVKAPDGAKVGTKAEIGITIAPKPNWVLKVETPFQAVVKPAAGVKVETPKLTSKDFVDPKSAAKSIKVTVVPETAGAHTVATDLTFFLCNETLCKRESASVSTPVQAQ